MLPLRVASLFRLLQNCWPGLHLDNESEHGEYAALCKVRGAAEAEGLCMLECATLRAVCVLIECGCDVSVYHTTPSAFVVRYRCSNANVYVVFRLTAGRHRPVMLEFREKPTQTTLLDYRPYCSDQLLFVNRAAVARAAREQRAQSQRVLAICMAGHPRLGAGSRLQTLVADVVERILLAVEAALPQLGPCDTQAERDAAWAALREWATGAQ